ncbi:MAG: hypothetical protein FWH36_02625 [Lentimicrobiaceae bacterium]|nr:hypothetical protein [Lentimicrobiaceae bacterium]
MRFFVFVIFCLLIGFSSCNRDKGVAAHVYDQKLTLTELQEMMPVFDKTADSVEILQQYIDTWIVRQVMLSEAKKNLSSKEKKFDRQLREYKESLLIDAYENKMARQLLDTVISDEEILMYRTNTDTILTDADKEAIKHAVLQQRKIELLKSLRKDAVNNAKESGEVLVH